MSILLSLRSETLKLKRTLAVYLCVAAAAFGPLMSFLEHMEPDEKLQQGLPWTQHFLEGREPICIALLPFYIILVCALMMQIENRDKTWKQVLSSPQPKINIFLGKFWVLQGMVLLFLLSYNLFTALTGGIIEIMDPAIYGGKLDLYQILTVNMQTWILSLGLSAIQFWISLRFRNFVAPLAIGLVGWFMSPMMLFQFKTDLVEYFPYAFTILSVMPDYKANIVTYQWYAIITAVVFLSIAYIQFRNRRVSA
ncbi:ABC transporter permease [Paracnuella aquatica]|uniref:ABC transporter permease n=1 Tax=Paracnuella aquatica TaxID=2268757 RepID=UPI00139011FD|nr:ABC transporter permease [Paracnuella aquatica]